MIRWKYVIPRLLVLSAVVVTIWMGTDPFLHWMFRHAAQQMFGAKVEVQGLHTDLLHGTIQLQHVCVADREAEFKNLVEFDQAVFDLDMHAALRRKLVIGDGQLTGLRFHTQRDASGRLADVATANEDASFSVSSTLDSAKERGETWLNGQLGELEDELENELQTIELGRELADRWPTAYHDLEQRASSIETQAKQLQGQIQAVADDPLQHLDQVQPLLTSLDQLRRDVVAARKQLTDLQRQMREDQQSLVAARRHDEEYIRERLRLEELDGRSLSEYLLGPVWSERIEVALRWLQQSREVVPVAESDEGLEPASRGISVIFPGFSASPDALVRRLRLSGEGTVDDKPFQFSGTLRDLTHQPRRHHEPTTIELESQGAIQLIAQGTLDRRSDQPVDRFVVDVPALRQPRRILGDPAKFAVSLAPGTAQVHADMTLHGDRIQGHVSLRQDQVQLTPALGPKVNQLMSPENVAAAIGGVNRFDAEVLLSGTIKAPRYELTSNLGQQLAAGLNQALGQELQRREQELISRVNGQVEQQLAKVQADLTVRHGDLLKKLELGDTQLSQLKSQLLSQVGGAESLISRGRKLLFK